MLNTRTTKIGQRYFVQIERGRLCASRRSSIHALCQDYAHILPQSAISPQDAARTHCVEDWTRQRVKARSLLVRLCIHHFDIFGLSILGIWRGNTHIESTSLESAKVGLQSLSIARRLSGSKVKGLVVMRAAHHAAAVVSKILDVFELRRHQAHPLMWAPRFCHVDPVAIVTAWAHVEPEEHFCGRLGGQNHLCRRWLHRTQHLVAAAGRGSGAPELWCVSLRECGSERSEGSASALLGLSPELFFEGGDPLMPIHQVAASLDLGGHPTVGRVLGVNHVVGARTCHGRYLPEAQPQGR
mmetsp:Transcript_119542/g.283868  ORF Transcript_119542/g.283868 Transcript_119542/m.283868 type:complete len:298 (-) Transcript_119542:17-910(-)